MRGRIVEISGTPRHLHLERGFLVIKAGQEILGRIDLEGILSLIITAHGASLTSAVIDCCATRNIPVLFCNHKFNVSAIAVPALQHSDQTKRFELQASAKKGLKNKLWQTIVRAKITNQARLIELKKANSHERLIRLAKTVGQGDPLNHEAQAAQLYWPALFGPDFRRNKEASGINSLLNYGYAILRSAMLRAVFATGLHPTFGLFHKNRTNPFCLVDDLMEPYRPLVDQLVLALSEEDMIELTPENKARLASIATADLSRPEVLSPLFQDMINHALQILAAFETGKATGFTAPPLFSELEVSAMVRQC